MNWKLVSILAFGALVICAAYLYLRGALFGTGGVSIAVQVAAAGLMIWARTEFGARSFHAAANPTEGGLVRSGPYRYLRHPIYASIFYFFWAGIATHFSLRNALVGVLASGMLALRMRGEEILLQRAYPEYADYARRTARVLPFVF